MSRKKKEEVESTVIEGEVVEVVEGAGVQEQAIDPQVLLQARVTACNQELSNVLAKYKCNLDPTFIVTGDGKITTQIRILPV